MKAEQQKRRLFEVRVGDSNRVVPSTSIFELASLPEAARATNFANIDICNTTSRTMLLTSLLVLHIDGMAAVLGSILLSQSSAMSLPEAVEADNSTPSLTP